MAKKKTTAQKQLEKAKADYAQSISSGLNWIKNGQSILKGNGPIVKEPAKGPAPITTLPAVKTKDGDVKITATDKQIASYYENYHLTQVAEAKKEKEAKKTAKTNTGVAAKTNNNTSDNKKTEVIGSVVKTLNKDAGKVSEKVSKKVAEKVSEKVAEKVAEKVSEKVSDKKEKFENKSTVNNSINLNKGPVSKEYSKQVQKPKAVSVMTKRLNDTYARYGINPDTFSLEDLGKWANDNNFQLTINQTTMEREYVPKKKGGFLGIGGEKLTTEQAERDLPTLKALAENNLRKELVKNEGYRNFMKMADDVTLGLSTMYQTAEAKKDYTKAGLNQQKGPYANKFVSPEEALLSPVETSGGGAWAKNNIAAGLASAAKGTAAFLDAVIPTDFLGDYDWFSYVNERFSKSQNAYAYGAKMASNGNRLAELGGQAIQMVIQALPQTALALMSGGTSTAGTLLPSVANTSGALAEVGKSMATNPLYWYSFMNTAGIEYEEARKKGASDIKASTAAVLSALIGSGIEVGGGIEGLPNKTGGFLKTIRDAALEEGSEEVWQGMISRGMAKAVYDSDKELFSLNNPDAVINPVTAAKEFAGGAFVGGLFGGATGGINQIVQNQQTTSTIKNIRNDPSRMGIIRELYRNGFYNTDADADIKTADAIIRMTSNSATKADMNMVENSEAAQKIVKILADDYTLARDVRNASGWKPAESGAEIKSEQTKTPYVEPSLPVKEETPVPVRTETVPPKKTEPVRTETMPPVQEETPKPVQTKTQPVQTEADISPEITKTLQGIGQRMGKRIIAVPEKITSILDENGTRKAKEESNGILYVDENTLEKEYRMMRVAGENGVRFKDAFERVNPVILDEQAAFDAYEKGFGVPESNEAEVIKEQPPVTNFAEEIAAEVKGAEAEETAPIFEEETNVNYNETAPAAENLSSEAFGKTAGQIVQNEASEEMKRLQPKAYSNIENMAKELGTRVTFVKGLVNEKGQKLDGKIDGDGIVINTEAEDPIRFAATHEFGHRMKQLDPDAWDKYQDHVIKYWQKQGTYDVKMRALKNVYGESMNTESLHEELACDFGEQMFKNEKTLSEFIKKDRTLAEKVKDVWFKVLSAFSDKARLRHAQNLWAKAYREATGKVEGSSESFDGVKFKVNPNFQRMFNNWKNNLKRKGGINFYVGETSESLVKIGVKPQKIYWDTTKINSTLKDHPDITLDMLKRIPELLENPILIMEPRNKKNNKSPGNNRIFVFGDLYNENGLPIMTVLELQPTDNNNLELNEIKVVSTHTRTDETNVTSIKQTQEFIEKSHLLYVNENKKRTNDWLARTGLQLPFLPTTLGPVDRITYKELSVNSNSMQNGEKNSQKQKIAGVKEAEANVERDILLEENKRLRDQIENMHIQLDQAEGKGLDLKKVKELATKLKETYHSTMPINEIHQELSKIYSSMTRQNVDGQEVYSRIYNLASDMVNSAIVKNDEQSMMYADLLDRMRKTKIVVPESERADFTEGYNEYRKHAMGKLTLANSGIELDAFWSDISTEYPHLFDEDVVGAKAKLDALLEVRNDLQPVYENFFGENESYVSTVKTYLANNIMNGFFKIPEKEGSTKYVFYDKRAAQIEKEAQKALKKAEEQFDKTITRLERKYVKNELKHSIDRDFGFLKNMSENPTNSRHVPQEMQGGVNQMLKLFDYGTKDAESLRESGKQKAKVRGVKLFKLADAYEKIIRDAFGLNGLRDDNNIVADKVLWNELADLRNEINSESAVDGELNSDLDKIIKIEDMNSKQLQTLNKLIKSVHHISVQKNKAFSDNINENIHDLGISVIKESRKVREEKKGKPGRTPEGDRKGWGEGKPLRNVLNFLDNVTNYDNLSAYDFFHRIGGTMEKLYGEMRKGFDKHIWNIKKAEEAISKAIGDKDVSKWTGESAKTQKFNLSSGEIELTPAQIMSLYALSKRPAAQEHLLFGGIQVGHGVAKKGLLKKDVASLKVHQLTAEDIAEITSTMSEEQKNLVDDVVKFMSTECAEWGNEASMKLYGYKKFGEKYYFPMNVAKSSLAQSFESKGSKKVQNAGATQTLAKGARNPLVLNDFFDVTAEHIATMSLYNSESLPMLDMERVLNYARWEINETEFGAEREYGATVREEFSRTWGESADRYIKKLMKDINGDRGGESSVWDKFLSNAKKVSVGGNTRVFLQQFTAVSRALNFINPIDFVGTFKKDNTKKMLEHSAIAYWKDLGFYDVNVGRTLKSILFEKMPVIDKLTLEPYGWADKATWSSIWGACEHEIKRTTDIPVGSEEFYKKVAEKFDYVIDRSQVVDSVFHRTQSMRSTNAFTKASTAFMSEPLKEMNMVRTEILDAVKNKNKMKTLPKVLTIYTVSAALQALAQLVPDMARKKPEDWYDEDKKKKDTKEMWMTEFFENFVDSLNPASKVPFVSDIYEMFQGYTQERFELSPISDLIKSLQEAKDEKKTPWQRAWNVISSVAVLKGIPAKNVTREFESYGTALFRINDGTEYGDYIVTKLKYDVKNTDNKSKFMKFYDAAINSGNGEAAALIIEDYFKSNGIEADDKNNAINAAKILMKVSKNAGEKSLMYELPDKSFTVDGEKYSFDGKEYLDYAETASDELWKMAFEVSNMEGFEKLTAEEQYEAMKLGAEYAYSLAKQKAVPEYELDGWKKELQSGETSIMQEMQKKIGSKVEKNYNSAIKDGNVKKAVNIMADYFELSGSNDADTKNAIRAAETLIEIAENAGKESLLYKLPARSFTVDGQEYTFEGNEYIDYAENASDKLWEMALQLVEEEGFAELPADKQYEAMSMARSYAFDFAKQEASSNFKLSGWKEDVMLGATSIMQEIQEKIAEEEKDRVGEELYQAFVSGGREQYNKVAAKYKGQFDNDYLSDAMTDAAKDSDEYKKDLAEYKTKFVVDTNSLSEYGKERAKDLRAEAATYYADKENIADFKGEAKWEKYDKNLKSKLDINKYIVFQAKLSEYKKELGKSSLKKAEATAFINRFGYSRSTNFELFRIISPNTKDHNNPYY